jgi:hypothetical protein
MKNPDLIPGRIREELRRIGLWEFSPRNLFRITWKNQPVARGGEFGGVNYIEFPSSLTVAVADHARCLQGISTDNLQELSYVDRRRIHN